MAPPLLTISDVGINLGDRWLLRSAHLALHAGDRLALVGRNGAGKSSLMKLEKLDNLVKSVEWVKLGVVSEYCPPDRKGLGC